jgi:hypothetical protein
VERGGTPAWIAAMTLSPEEMRELNIDAWRMVVPKKVVAAHLGADGPGRAPGP